MKGRTMMGLVAGSVVGMAVGAGLLMMPQGKQMKKNLEKGAAQMRKHFSEWTK